VDRRAKYRSRSIFNEGPNLKGNLPKEQAAAAQSLFDIFSPSSRSLGQFGISANNLPVFEVP
jgi:hypothetical protein